MLRKLLTSILFLAVYYVKALENVARIYKTMLHIYDGVFSPEIFSEMLERVLKMPL